MTLFGSSRTASELAIKPVIGTARVGTSPSKSQAHAAAQTAQARSVPAAKPMLSAPSEGALQTAARLKVLLGHRGGTVAVTGLGESDSATPLAAALGLALAALDESRVLVVDANIRNARLHEFFRVRSQPGILELLEQRSETSLADKLVRLCNGQEEGPNTLNVLQLAVTGLELNNLFFLPIGKASASLAALLSHPHGKWMFDEIRKAYRYVVIDVGAIQSGAEGVLLAAMTEGVVAALASGARRRHEVVQFRQELNHLNIRLFGVVLTKAL